MAGIVYGLANSIGQICGFLVPITMGKLTTHVSSVTNIMQTMHKYIKYSHLITAKSTYAAFMITV